jgi:DNA-binding transcriptional MerR regulator
MSRSCGPAPVAASALDLRGEIGDTTGQEMRDLLLDEAAAVLCVSPETLRAWEQRFGYPHSVFRAAGQRCYDRSEVIALRDSLEAGLSIASAINTARAAGTEGDTPDPY